MKQFATAAKQNHFTQTKHRDLGLIQQRDFSCYDRAGYLNIVVSITTVADAIILKKIYVETRSTLNCVTKKEPLSWLQDYVYLNTALIELIDFPIHTCANCPALVFDSLYDSKIADLRIKYPGYKFPSTASRVNGIENLTYSSFIPYDYQLADKLMLGLIETKAYAELVNLVFSPNYSIAINACEALTYLDHKKIFSLDDKTRAELLKVKNSDVPITITCGPDCMDTKPSYRILNVLIGDIIKKYEKSLALKE